MKYPAAHLMLAGMIGLVLTFGCSDREVVIGPQDSVEPPDAIEDLSVSHIDLRSVTLTWTAPDSCLSYDIRYYNLPIDTGNWSAATQVTDPPAPQDGGATESVVIDSLEPYTDCYFAVIYNKDSSVWSPLSNIVHAFTSYNSSGKIVFQSVISGQAEIYEMDWDGSNMRQVANGSLCDNEPCWTPDGQRIIFTACKDNFLHLYVMNSDGSDQTKITTAYQRHDQAAVCSSNPRIAFTSWSIPDPYGVYICSPDGSDIRRISQSGDTADYQPDWSPDGTRIAFTSSRRAGTSGAAVFTMDTLGANIHLVADPGWCPSYSPDGTRIAYADYRNLCIVDVDGSNKVTLTDRFARVACPDWSPDGEKIVFVAGNSLVDDCEIYVINADGTNEVQLTHNSVLDWAPCWSPMQ